MWVRFAGPGGPGTPSSLGVAAALAALVAWSFWQRWQLLDASPFPLGVDGYFYPIQLRALLDHGQLAYPASPLAFYLLAPLAAVTDPITGAKLGAALYGAAIAVPAYGVGARLGGGRGPGLVAAALATTSAGSAYLTVEFVKNGIGLTVALTALWLALAAAERPTRGRIAAALAGIAAAWATHKMAAALVGIVAVPAALAAATAHGRLRGRRLLYAIGGLVGAAAVALGIAAVFPHRFLSVGDAALLGGLISTTPRWSAPALALPSGDLVIGHDALLGLVLAVPAAAVLAVRRHRRAVVAAEPGDARPSPPVAAASWPILGLAIAIGLPLLAVTDRDGLGFRLRLAAFVPAALSAAILARVVLGRRAHRGIALAAFAALAALLVATRRPGSRLNGEIVTHPALVSAALALRGRVPPGATLIIPERHIAFLVAWYTGAPVAIRPDAIAPPRRYRLLPLHFIRAGSALDRQLIAARAEPALIPPLGVHPGHPNGLVLVAEPTWTWVIDHLPAAERARAIAWPTL
jgi:hypothetical protein